MSKPIFAEVRAIYFDLDDTLCAYWDAARAGLLRTFKEFCSDLGEAEEVLQHWATEFRAFCPTLKQTGWYDNYLKRGEPTRTELMRLVLLRFGIDDSSRARQLGDRYNAYRGEALALFEDAEAVLTELKKMYPLGLITNGPADTQRQEIATLGITRYFQNIFIEGEMGKGKPHADVFHGAERAVNEPPEKILFVGNSYAHDIAPAINHGWRTAWVRRPSDVPPSSGDHNPEPESLPIGAHPPDLTIGRLTELLSALGT